MFVYFSPKVIGIDEGYLNLLSTDEKKGGGQRDDLKLPDGDLGKEILEKFEEHGTLIVSFHACLISDLQRQNSLRQSRL